jgi:hypothetical protein
VLASVPVQEIVTVPRSTAADVPREPVLVRPRLVETASATSTASVLLVTVVAVTQEPAPVKDQLAETASATNTASALLAR